MNFIPQHVFVNRVRELKFLEDQFKLFKRGLSHGVIVYGLRRIGKTRLIKEFLRDKVHLEINCGGLSTVDSFFWETVFLIRTKFGLEDFARKWIGLFREVRGKKMKFRRILDMLVECADFHGPYILFIDEFHLLLDKIAISIAREEHTNSERALLDIFWALKSAIEKGKVFWILSTSIGWEKLREFLQMRQREAPLLGVLSRLEVKPLDFEASIELAMRANEKISRAAAEEIANLSGGIPKIIIDVSTRILPNESPLAAAMRLINEGYFDDIFDNMIRFVSELTKFDYTTITNVIALISEEKRVVREISEQMGLDSRVVSAILKELQKIGIVEKSDDRPGKYRVSYPLLEAWATMRLRDRPLEDKMRRALYTLGLTAESYIREIFMEMVGKKVVLRDDKSGSILAGIIDEISFSPTKIFSKKETDELFSKLGLKNGDLVVEEDNRIIILEVKAGIRDLDPETVEKLANIVERINVGKRVIGIIVYMGEGEIKPRAIILAKEKGILILTRRGVKLLAKKVGLPPI